jgi:hypothetical protein
VTAEEEKDHHRRAAERHQRASETHERAAAMHKDAADFHELHAAGEHAFGNERRAAAMELRADRERELEQLESQRADRQRALALDEEQKAEDERLGRGPA